MDKLKCSAILNTKKPASLYELHSRLAALQYQAQFLPYLKDVIFPLHFLLRKKEFSWGEIEDRAWQQAKELAALQIRLVVPNAEDNLVLTTDASKIAASACLFKEINGKLQLVSLSSKYFATVDLNKNSYMLESLSLAYALKVFAPYLLNCTGKIKIFTDAKSLIYAKRMSTHSIMLNSTLNYLTNFVSLVNVDLYHLPGTVNVLADVLSRAICDNLQCSLPKEHPLSKQWAKVIPPIPNKFMIDHDTLYQFLTQTVKSEPQDIYERKIRKLNEPKTLQDVFDFTSHFTPEEKYNSAISLLEQWNSEYARKNSKDQYNQIAVNTAKLQLNLEKQQICLEKIREIMDFVYDDIKDSTNNYIKT
jgi:hypothetical protein